LQNSHLFLRISFEKFFSRIFGLGVAALINGDETTSDWARACLCVFYYLFIIENGVVVLVKRHSKTLPLPTDAAVVNAKAKRLLQAVFLLLLLLL